MVTQGGVKYNRNCILTQIVFIYLVQKLSGLVRSSARVPNLAIVWVHSRITPSRVFLPISDEKQISNPLCLSRNMYHKGIVLFNETNFF